MSEDPNAFYPAGGEEKEEFKCYIGRVPSKFTEEIVKRNLVEKLRDNTYSDAESSIVEKVELIYPHDDKEENPKGNNNNNDGYRNDRMNNSSNHSSKNNTKESSNPTTDPNMEKEHRGFGFAYFSSAKYRDAALQLAIIKGKRKTTSKKSYSLYLCPYVAKTYDDDETGHQSSETSKTSKANTTTGRDICYLWSLYRCPYGDNCKFRHVGEGGCLLQEKDLSPEEQKRLQRKRKGKCFVYKKKGKCSKGEDCPFSHDFEPDATTTTTTSKPPNGETTSKTTTCVVVTPLSNSQKDCINWKTKGKCRKGDKCPYKHDPELQKRALDKIGKRKRLQEGGGVDNDAAVTSNNKRQRKQKQPISIRVFGMNYDTTEADIQKFIEQTCGHPIKSMVFPRFEDSGRSKGYCGVYFASPKAATAAVKKCDNADLHGRWLRVQAGKSMTIDQWEGLHRR